MGGLDLPLPRHTVRTRARMLGFVALTVVCVSTATGYVLHSRARVRAVTQAGAARPGATPGAVAAPRAGPPRLFRNTWVAAPRGRAARAPLYAPAGAPP